MKRIVLLMALNSPGSTAQNVVIRCTFHLASLSKLLKVPIVISWWLTNDMARCDIYEERENNFTDDPPPKDYTIPSGDYADSGYDRTQNMPASNNVSSATRMKECSYYAEV